MIFFACYTPVAAQCITYHNTRQFLGTSGVFHILRDGTGFLWFCTDNGLIKYDGHSMQRFTRQTGLADNIIFSLYEDRHGRIWPFCANGRYCYIEGDSVHNELNDPVLAKLPHTTSYITYMASAGDSGLYMSFLSRQILTINRGKNAWLPQKPGQHEIIIERDKIAYTDKPTGSIVKFSDTKKLVSDKEGIKIFDHGKRYWQKADKRLTELVVTDLCLTDNQHLIVCSTNGLIIVNLNTDEQTTLLRGIRVSGCATDISGNFWISTVNDGIYQLHQELDHIRMLKGFERAEWIRVNDDRVVSVKDGKLYELTEKNGLIKPITALSGVPGYYNPVLLTDQLAGFYNMWDKCMIVQSRNGNTLLKLPLFAKKTYTAPGNMLWVYGFKDASYYRADSKGLILRNETSYAHKITASAKDPATGALYFISGKDLYLCDFQEAKSKRIFSSSSLENATSLLAYHSRLLITTDTTGYYMLTKPGRDDAALLFLKTDFIPYRLLPLNQEKILAASDIADFLIPAPGAPGSIQAVQYPFPATDYEHLTILGNNCIIQLNGETYYFDIALLNKRLPPSNICIKRLIINGRDYTADSIDIRNTLKLDIRVSIGIIDFSKNRHAFRYRLTGPDLNGEWIRTEATELGLILRNAGEYRIEIAADDGTSNFNPVVRTIIIHTPFIRSATFYALCVVLMLILCLLTFFLVLRYRERHFVKEFGYLRLEHNAINALLNPHFIFNTINNIQGLIFRSERQTAADYLSALSRLIRQNLENLQYNLIPLENELEMIERYLTLQNLRFEGRISFSVQQEYESVGHLQIPPLLLHTFIENAIVHGFTANDHLHIRLSITRHEDEYVRIFITDNGMGMNLAKKHPSAHQKKSMGIAFNQKRLERLSDFYNLRQSVSVSDLSVKGDRGTEVVIILYTRLEELFGVNHLPVH